MKVEKDYEDLLGLFNKHKVEYLIVGSFAVAFYSKPRYTKDIDILINPTIENANRIVIALEEFGFKGAGLTPDDFLKKGQIIQLGYEPVRIDILTSINGLEFNKAWKNKNPGQYGNETVQFIGLKDLIKIKTLANRKLDKHDLKFLKKIKRI
jgi:predicted nucleotidyltransferase